jgi:hypothetical protein
VLQVKRWGNKTYPTDGKEVVELAPPKLDQKSLRDTYKNAEVHTKYGPYSEQDFCNFVYQYNKPVSDSVINAG